MNDDVFRRMAAEYVRQSGTADRREMDSLPQHLTPTLDKRVRSGVNAMKRRRYSGIAGLVAAGLLLVLLVPTLLFPNQQSTAPEAEAPVYEMLPLSFELPEQFSVASVEQDIEKTVYYLDNSELDDVVMTLEANGDLSEYQSLTAISIDGSTAYGSSIGDFSILAFEAQDVLYVLTCEHDINTLLDLSLSII